WRLVGDNLRQVKISVLRRKEFRRLPWKNGRGVTEELAIFPAGSSFAVDPFLWRLSMAPVQEPGPFSPFPGYDRLLTLLDGSELSLLYRSGNRESVTPDRFTRFSGDLTVAGEPSKGPVTDFGILFRRDAVRVEAQILNLKSRLRSISLIDRTTFLVA